MIFFEKKQVIEDLEADLTGAPIDASNIDDAALTEVEILMNPSLQ